MYRLLFTITFSFVCFLAQSQERCGTVEYEKLRSLRNPNHETTDQFEKWIAERLSKKTTAFKADRVQGGSYVVPIVVHVIHNGEAVGTGANISDAQVLSQIAVINNDFKRLNADTTKTPAEFVAVAGKFNITFVMAQQDPNGLATNGITRTQGTQASWSISDNYAFKALSYWPAENYLNIWVVNLTGGLLGYTQLPVSSTLQGLQTASTDRLTDGVVVDYQSYGTNQAAGGSSFNLLSEYPLGRTATHEIGHFFGLRHVWGDVNSCDPAISTDYVADTPIQNTDYNGTCPSVAQTECSVHSMYDNYMNYTDDACMNIFSQGQVGRMDVIINNSPRRVSLLTSPGSQPPAPVANDLGVKTILSPGTSACSGNVTPSITIRNYGTNKVTSSQVQLFLNGISLQTQTLSSLNLAPSAETSVNFSSVPVSAGITYNFSFTILQTNGGTDGNPANNSLAVSTLVPISAPLPLMESFNSLPAGWQILNPDNLTTWTNISLGSSQKAMYLDFFSYENQGASDWLITPVLDLTTATVASLSFNYAYATYPGGGSDQLRVLVSSVCDFNQSTTAIFNKKGTALATAPSTSNPFVPTSTQWITSLISLNQFIGQKIQIAFVGTNQYGNNLYLDNVAVLNNPVTALTLNSLSSPSPVSCQTTAPLVVNLTNLGNSAINSFTADVFVNNQSSKQVISGIQLNVGASQDFTLAPVTFATGNNTLSIAIRLPNGVTNFNAKDSLSTSLFINEAADIIPLRQNFDGVFTPAWSMVSPSSGQVWSPATTNYSNSLVFNSITNANLGEQAWLASPVLNFSKVAAASLFFQTSYASSSTGSETLQVFSSADCGETYSRLLFASSGTSLANTVSNTSWLPTNASQWKKNFINLDTLAGKQNVRLAFVATNGNGNNLYLDNIEFFTSDNPSPVDVSGLYSIYGGSGTPVNVTFDLPDRQLVRMQVYDLLGRVISDNLLPDTLNQTYTIDFPNDSRGMYIVRIQTATSIGSTKVLLGF